MTPPLNDKILVLVSLAALFHAARLANSQFTNPGVKESFNEARKFMAEAERNGLK